MNLSKFLTFIKNYTYYLRIILDTIKNKSYYILNGIDVGKK